MIGQIPVIGVLATRYYKSFFKIDYSIYKWLDSSGAIVLYIDPRLSNENLYELIMHLDGIIIPGGGDIPCDSNPTYQTAKNIFKIAEKLGNFPVMGICMGIQFMLTYYSNNSWNNVKTIVNNYGYSSKTNIVAPLKKTFLATISEQLITNHNLAFNHKHAISVNTFYHYKNLPQTFKLLTTSKHKQLTFVSSIQGKNYPFFGIQWHPEKPAYEWNPNQNIARDPNAVKIGKIIGDIFVEYCRETGHKTSLEIFMKYNLNHLTLTSHKYLKVNDPEYYDEPLVKFIFN